MRLNLLLAGVSAGVLAAVVASQADAQQQNQASSQSPPPVASPSPSPSFSGAMTTAPENDAAPYTPEPPPAPMTMQDMQARIEDLQRQLDFMKQVAAEQTGTVAAVAAQPKATLANGRPGWASADGSFTAAINGVLQFDAGNYYQGNALPSQITGAARDLNGGTNARRARFGFGGKMFTDFDYNFLYEFGGSGAEDAGHIQELWFQYTGLIKPFHVRVGYFEPLVGMEANVSTNSIALLERASPAEIARGVAAGDSRAAFQVFGNDDFKNLTFADGGKVHWMASAAVTGNTVGSINSASSVSIPALTVNGATTVAATSGALSAQPFDEQLAVVGRVGVAPYHGDDYTVHVGVNVQHVFNANDTTGRGGNPSGKYVAQLRDRPELRLDGTRLIDTGALNVQSVTVEGAEFGAQFKSFFVQSEYFHFDFEGNHATAATTNPHFNGYYVEGSYLLTGEHRVYNPANGAFNGPAVAHPFNLKDGGFGAVELAARFSDMDLNFRQGAAGAAAPLGGVRGGEQKSYAVSLNWYLNSVIRFMVQGQHVDIDRLNAAGLPLNQGYDTIAVRSQLAF